MTLSIPYKGKNGGGNIPLFGYNVGFSGEGKFTGVARNHQGLLVNDVFSVN